MSPNVFGISEVAGGIPPRNTERQFRVFRVMRSRDRRERQAEPELFPKTLCRKGATGGSDFGITYPSMRSSLFGFNELIY